MVVRLLDLPPEILELIVGMAVEHDQLILSSLSSRISIPGREAAIAFALSTRLVHSRFRQAADPHIFTRFHCTLQEYFSSNVLTLLKEYGRSYSAVELEAWCSLAYHRPEHLGANVDELQSLLGMDYPRLEMLLVQGVEIIDDNKETFRPWSSFHFPTFPKLRTLEIAEPFFLPKPALHSSKFPFTGGGPYRWLSGN